MSVVIASYRREPGPLGEVVERFVDQGADEVVVVLDGPQPASRACLERIDDPRLIVVELDENVGQALAKLRGVQQARSRLVLTADDDILVDPGVVDRQRLLHHDRDDLVVVGFIPVATIDGSLHGVASRIFDAEYRAVIERWEREPETILEGVYGGIVSTPRRLFLAAHEHKPTAPLPYYEDLDLGLRLAAVGGTGRFDIESSGRHLHDKSLEAFAADARQRRRSLAALRARWGEIPTYTQVPDSALERLVRQLYHHISAAPGVGAMAESVSWWTARLAGRRRFARGEDLAARVLRGVLEAAEAQELRAGPA